MSLNELSPSAVAPGNHDGVHLGHRALVRAAKERADERGLRTIGLFFDPHPTKILAPERAPVLLTTVERRRELLLEAGCDEVIIKRFDEEFAQTEPRVFVDEILVGSCDAKVVVTGPDFHFGRNRSGDINSLRAFGEERGFEVVVEAPVLYKGEASSSTRIRAMLREGRVEDAAAMLTRFHENHGVVVRGFERGRLLGFPTANLELDGTHLPKDGVYLIAALDLDTGLRRFGVANIGERPTMKAGRSVEAHLFGFEGDLYGHQLRVGYIARLRDEKRFGSIAELEAQIRRDADQGRALVDEGEARWRAEGLLRWL
ncbi:MAG: riboflavin biosynthesis protein RibF [Sandaracinaceae bacterium]|nr:riboflavin biosynthesis protein RibF [Sandaracinaceae bacterium]